MGYRPQRLAQQLKSEISHILTRELKNVSLGFLTVTNVEVSRDMRNAKVLVSLFDSPEKQKETMAKLKASTGFVRRQLGSRLRLRFIPEIIFSLDSSIAEGDRMSRLIEEVARELPPVPDAETHPDTAKINENIHSEPESAEQQPAPPERHALHSGVPD